MPSEMYAREMHARKMHTRKIHASEMHAHQVHAHETHAHQMHAHEIYAHRSVAFPLGKKCQRTLSGTWASFSAVGLIQVLLMALEEYGKPEDQTEAE
jgi:hypothetical protein